MRLPDDAPRALVITVRAVLIWPAAALAAIMAAGRAGPGIETWQQAYWQISVFYPLILGASCLARYLLQRAGQAGLADLPLLAPLVIVLSWVIWFLLVVAGLVLG